MEDWLYHTLCIKNLLTYLLCFPLLLHDDDSYLLNLFQTFGARPSMSVVGPSLHHENILYNFDPLNPTFIKENWGLQEYTLFLLKNIDFGYSLEPPRRGGSNEYSQSIF